ncbi:unnamed protein product [Onchocerca flexuosa]|uniref:Secreted protein n=1 Tax=Onchocerca flexuosa TaxID=387005 RepID=A0A183HKB9_9BILA|nr:unnamed protein product [Onchocerca flexuosa]
MFRLLVTIQLLQFSLAYSYWPQRIIGYHHIPVMINMFYLLQTEVSNKGVAALLVQSPMHRTITPGMFHDTILINIEPNHTVVVEQPNPMFPASSVDETPASVPVSITLIAPGVAITRTQKVDSSKSNMGIIGADKQYSSEIFKRRVRKMVIAPRYREKVTNPPIPAIRYGRKSVDRYISEIFNQASKSEQHGKGKK